MRYDNFILSPFNDWQQVDVVVSRDCTLRCTYCYLHKNKEKSYDIDAIVSSFDDILSTCDKKGVILSLYPEPWVNIDRTNELIKKCLRVLTKYPKYSSHYMVMLSTNGVKLTQKIPIVEHLKDRLSLAVTLDGVKEQHDLYRVFENGLGSWGAVKSNILKYQKEYHIYSTKVTLGPETVKFMYDSTLFLWEEMNFQDVNMNVVFENLWGSEKEKTLEVFETQLDKLSDYIIKSKVWQNKYVSVVGTRNIPDILIDSEDHIVFMPNKTYCGAVQMRSIDVDGSVYPCFRLSPYSMKEDKTFKISHEKNESIRTLKLLNNYDAVTSKCRKCALLSACSMCVGGAFEEKNSLFWRTTHHCEFQKLQYKYSVKVFNAINPDHQIKKTI